MSRTEVHEPSVERRQWRGSWVPPVGLYLGTLAVLLVTSWLRIRGDPTPGVAASFPGRSVLGGWAQFDSDWYLDIAGEGYTYLPGQQSRVAFFPGYPLSIRAVGAVVGSQALGAFMLTVASGLGAMLLYGRWVADRLAPRAACLALAALAVYPFSWFLFGAIYGDALFLVLVLGAFALFERHHYVLAGLVGAAACGTRFVGVALVAAMVVGVLERRDAFEGRRRFALPRRIRIGRLQPGDAWVLLAVVGLLAWMAWLWHRFGDPFLFSSVQKWWGQPSSPRTWLKVDFFTGRSANSNVTITGNLLVQGLLACAALASAPAVGRRFGARYGVYVAVIVAIPLVGSRDFQGLGRYLIGAFPAFALLGERLAELPRLRLIVLLTCSAVLLLKGTYEYAGGRYLS